MAIAHKNYQVCKLIPSWPVYWCEVMTCVCVWGGGGGGGGILSMHVLSYTS